MTTISSALSLVDPLGAAGPRQAPAPIVSGETGFEAIFARALEQPERPAPPVRSGDDDRGVDDRGVDDRGALSANDRRLDERTERRSEIADDRAGGAVEHPSATATDEIGVEHDDDAVDDESQEVAVASGAGLMPVPTQVATAVPGQMTPSLAPVAAAVTNGVDPAVAALEGVPTATVPSTAPAGQQPGSVPVGSSPEPAAVAAGDGVTGVDALGVVGSIDATAGGTAGPQLDAGRPEVAAAPTAADVPAAPAASSSPAEQQLPTGPQTSPTAPGSGAPVMPTAADAAVAAEVVADAAALLPAAAAATADGGDATPGAASDARPSVTPVGAVSSSAPTVADRVEAATVRTAEAESQRALDGTRIRDRFVGNGLGGTMTVDLSDEGLGQLSLQAHQGGGALHVTLAAGESSTRELLLSQSASLRSELESLGALGSLDVTDSLPGGGGGRGTPGDERTARAGDTDRRGRSDRPGGASGPSSAAGSTGSSSVRPSRSSGIDLLI